MEGAAPITVELAGITKRYPRVVANRGARLLARRGEIHAVVGENGAGKSTLMKILYGLVTPDEGQITVCGHHLSRHDPAQAIAAGVGMVFQHFMLVPSLTVAENIVLGREPVRGPWLDRRRAEAEVAEVSRRFGLEIDPTALVLECSVGVQQRVEILKVLLRGAEVIILDEPTAVLTPHETDELIRVMKRLAREGKTILLITHKLREVMAAADRVTIMRRGETLETLDVEETSAAEIAEKMVGRALEPPHRVPGSPGQVVLEVSDLSAMSDRGVVGLRNVSLSLRSGEILGIAAIEGNGQTELLECIAGLRRPTSGTIRLGGRDLTTASVAAHLAAGVAHIPEDRHARGVILDFTVEENVILGSQRLFSGPLGLELRSIRRHAEALTRGSDVRPPDPTQKMRSLSGGNQQKVVIGREVARRPDVETRGEPGGGPRSGASPAGGAPRLLLAAHPTRGLDIGAIEHVQRTLREARDRGAAIVLVSGELTELLAMSDRMIVLAGGRIRGEVDPAAVDERALGLMMTGQDAGVEARVEVAAGGQPS